MRASIAAHAFFRCAADLAEGGHGDQHKQSAVRAEVAAPGQLDQDREDEHYRHEDEEAGSRISEEAEHMDIDNLMVGGGEKILQGRQRHSEGGGKEKEGKEEIFEAAQRQIDPEGGDEVAAEKFVPKAPQPFAESEDRADPRTEAAFEEEGGQQGS